jgi:hypothetical protein
MCHFWVFLKNGRYGLGFFYQSKLDAEAYNDNLLLAVTLLVTVVGTNGHFYNISLLKMRFK